MRLPITIDGMTFKTKQALKAYIRAIVARYEDYETLGPEDFAFMLGVLQFHRRREVKVGCGVASMQVRTALPFPSRGFWIIRTDGTETDFSWPKCIDPPTRRRDVMAAMRAAVFDQIQAFREDWFVDHPLAVCPLTGESLSGSECHVDHIAPDTFDALAVRFLVEHGLDIEDVRVADSVDRSVTTGLADPHLNRSWRDFHRTHARLRLLSKRGNLSIARRKAPCPP